MGALAAVDSWDSLRLGIGHDRKLSSLLLNRRARILCNQPSHGLAHLLASCTALNDEHASFLAAVDIEFADKLRESPSGDWHSVLLSPHLELSRLK